MQVWVIGRVLDDGTQQTYSNDDGTVKSFPSEGDAQEFINANLKADGNVFPFALNTDNVVPLMPGGNA